MQLISQIKRENKNNLTRAAHVHAPRRGVRWRWRVPALAPALAYRPVAINS